MFEKKLALEIEWNEDVVYITKNGDITSGYYQIVKKINNSRAPEENQVSKKSIEISQVLISRIQKKYNKKSQNHLHWLKK